MRRRTFLTGAATISAAVLCPEIQADSPQRAIQVAAGQARFGEHRPMGGGGSVIDWKVSGQDSNGGWCTFESQWHVKGGPPLHIHRSQDEWFYIVQSEFIAQVGDERFRVSTGDSLFLPRQIPHAFAHVGDGEGKMIVAYQPAGSMEDFFREQSKLTGTLSPEEAKQMYRAHGLELVGPPLSI